MPFLNLDILFGGLCFWTVKKNILFKDNPLLCWPVCSGCVRKCAPKVYNAFVGKCISATEQTNTVVITIILCSHVFIGSVLIHGKMWLALSSGLTHWSCFSSFPAAIVSNPRNMNCTPHLTFSLPHLPTPPLWYLAFHCCLTADGTWLLERRASDLWSVGSDCQPVRKHPGWLFIIAPVPQFGFPVVPLWLVAPRS